MTIPYLKIKKPDGTEFQTDELGLKIVDFYIPPLQTDLISESVDLGLGEKILGYNIKSKTLKVEATFYYRSIIELRYLERQLSEVLDTTVLVELSESTLLGQIFKGYIKPYELDRGIGTKATITFDFLVPNGIGESFDIKKEKYDITNSVQRIEFFNDGTFRLDPRDNTIFYIEVLGATNDLQITNISTGDYYKSGLVSYAGQTVTLKDCTTYVNGVDTLEYTNKRVITMRQGRNILEVKNAQNTTLTIVNKLYFG